MLNSVGTPGPADSGRDHQRQLSQPFASRKSGHKLTQLKVVDEWHMKLLAGLFQDLKSIREGGETLLVRR
jgi:hypothetical protein